MNTYLRDQLVQLAVKSEDKSAEHHATAKRCREDGNIVDAIWWEGLADKARNRAIRCREEAGDGHS